MQAWRAANRRTIDERWSLEQAEQDRHRDAVGSLTDRELFLVGVALYWAEGAKSKPWRRSHLLSFVNSDEAVIRTFLAWLDLVGVSRDRLRCAVLIHEFADVEAAEAFWRQVVGPEAVFNATCLKRHSPTTMRKNVTDGYRGCLSVRVSGSASTYRLVAGTWEGMAAAVASDPAG